jgi:hypothetical protein
MSSVAIADLAGSLGNFCASLREAMERDRVPPKGSPAEKEADGEPFAGDWGQYPSRDIHAAVLLATASCADHLTGAASVLLARNAPFSPYMLSAWRPSPRPAVSGRVCPAGRSTIMPGR